MQITEQLIERIARRVFNSMFAPALRQSNVQGGGTTGSVRYADEAGHAASADSADAVPWTGVSGKPATATRWPTWSEVTDKPTFAAVATSGSYNDLSNKPSIPTPSNTNTGYAANADHAVSAGSATTAGTATYANSAGSASSAGYATSAGSADYATSAGSAGSAGYAGYISDGTMDAIAQYNNELNFGGSDGSSTIYFGYRARGAKAIPTSFIFGGSSGSASVTCARVYSNGGVTALSDARKKDVLGNVELSVDDIARMPAVRFRWKDLDQKGTFIGTLAQSWSKILPEAVQPIGNNIGFDYNGAAIVAVVNLAKAVQKIIAKMDRYGFK